MSEENHKQKEIQKINSLTSAWLHQMSSVWSMHKYAALVEGGSLSAWYLLVQKKEFMLSSALLVVSSSLLYLMVLTVRRHAQLLQKFSAKLSSSDVLPKGNGPIGLFGGKSCAFSAHQLARVFIALLILVNFILLISTFIKSDYNCFILILCVIHTLIAIPLVIRWKKLIKNVD